MSKPMDQLEREVADARARLASAVRDIDARLTPAGLADEALTGFLKSRGRGTGPSARRSIGMLAGYAGLKFALRRLTGRREPDTNAYAASAAWKEDEMAGSRKNGNDDARPEDLKAGDSSNPAADIAENVAGNVRRVARRAGEAASEVAEEARDAKDDVVGVMREKGREAVDEGLRRGRRGYERVRARASDRIDDAYEQAEHVADLTRESIEEASAWAEERYREAADMGARSYREARRFARSNPAAVGAIGLAAGLVLGALLARGGRYDPPPRRARTRDEYDYDYDDRDRRR